MAKASSTFPLTAGGRTLRKPSKGSSGGGGSKKKRKVWYQDGTGRKFAAPTPCVAYPTGEVPVNVKK